MSEASINQDDLPTTWALTNLGSVINYGSTSKAEPNEIGDDDWVLELEDIEKDSSRLLQKMTFLQRQSKSTKNHFQAGDVLYGKLRPYLNKVLIAGEPGYCTTEILPLKTGTHIDNRYLFYWLKHPVFLKYVEAESHGMNMPRLGTETGKAAPFVLAPRSEQTRIANQLDTLLTRVQACNDRFDAIPALLKRFRQTVLDAATTGGLTDDWRQSESSLGTQAPDAQQLSSNELPFGWKQYQLRELVDCFDNARIPIKASERAKRQGAFSYYGAFGIIDSIDDFLFDGEYLLLAEDGKNLESRDRPIALIANGKFWVNNHAHVIRPKNALDIRFLLHWLNSKSCDISDLLTGIDQIKLTRGAMDRIPVPLPPATEQTEIVRRVEALFALADRIEARCTAARAQAQRLTPLVLAKAFRGELVPQDPNDEPASALLARIASADIAVAGKNKRKVPVVGKERAQAAINL